MNPPQTKRWRTLRRCLVGLAVCLTLIGLFYTVENWRGKRAWNNCKRAMQAQGVNLDWAAYIPASVPNDQNVFGVPEMQKWFTGRGTTELSKRLFYPGYGSTNRARLVLAELTIVLPGTSAPSASGATVLQWGDPQAKVEAARLLKDALGPVVVDPIGSTRVLRSPEEIRPAQILLHCQSAPASAELLQFLPKPIANATFPDSEGIRVELTGSDSYKVTMAAPDTVADYLKWSDQLEPQFALIRQALQRPHARMEGNYEAPSETPIPNFVTVRILVQMLAARAQCYFLAGQPEEALRDLTLMHDICRPVMEENKPMTLVAAMINVAVRGLYAQTIADGMRLQAWREPQLATLEGQLKQINVLSPVQRAFELEPVFLCHELGTKTPAQLAKLYLSYETDYKANSWKAREISVLAALIPRGWVYQNRVTGAKLFPNLVACMDSAGQMVFPDKTSAYSAFKKQVDASSSHWSPYTFMASFGIPNYDKACQTTARNQTMINQALIVCALERFRLAHGQYPETLDALAPQFIAAIPHDVIGGQPLHYRRAADGTFLLYSVGWNGLDDGGTPGKSITEGDWVWPVFP